MLEIGMILAGCLSYSRNDSLLLAAVHGLFLGWIYVIYYALTQGK